jgi:hypothetical protein
MAKAPAKKKEEAKKKSGKSGVVGIMILLGCATPFIVPTVMLLVIGLIPTYVELAIDNDRQKSGAVSVGAMNFAGIVPFIIDLWSKGQTMQDALQIMASANTWLVILGAAGIGKLIVHTIPQALATLTLTHAESRVKSLRKNLDMLKDSWGPDVATNKPVDSLIPN